MAEQRQQDRNGQFQHCTHSQLPEEVFKHRLDNIGSYVGILGNWTKKVNKVVNLSIKEFIANQSRHRIIRNMKRKNPFHYEFKTDGIGASVLYADQRPPPPEDVDELLNQQEEKYNLFGQRYARNEYGKIIGMDPGYKPKQVRRCKLY